jgi:threonine dehydrogenase-like Zn-dependent dehydrogenase
LRALTFRGVRAVAVESVTDPRIERPTDALVRVRLAAVCGSDLHVYRGRETGLDAGTVMGHEFVGEVLETGREVTTLARGDRVLSPFTTSCGECFFCREGLTARCVQGQLFGWVQDGHGLHGAQAEYVRVALARSTLVRVGPEVPDETALLLGDVASTGFHGARQGGVGAGSSVAVLGCGAVGLCAIVAARHLGAARIFAVDGVPERLALAARLGAEAIPLADGTAVQRIGEATAGRGVDAVLEAVGGPEATRAAFELVRPGGTISSVGVHTERQFSFSPIEAYDRNLTYRTGRCPARAVLEHLLPVVRGGRYDLTAVISHRMTLEQGPQAYALFDRRAEGCTKVVLRPA